MKKKTFGFLIILLIASIFLVDTIQASAAVVSKFNTKDTSFQNKQSIVITGIYEKSDYETFNSYVNPRGATCCGQSPRLAWRTTQEWHQYQYNGLWNKCERVSYYGDQYCLNCGAVWQRDVKYKETAGCGKYH